MNTLVLADKQKLAFISFVHTGWHREDLPSCMSNKDRWQKKIKGIYAISRSDDDT